MKRFIMYLMFLLFVTACTGEEKNSTPYNRLTAEEQKIILLKGTEPPFSGEYNSFYEKGQYHCKLCNLLLFSSDAKFDSKTGWPSFDSYIPDAVETEKDGYRTEIHCARCKGHLGHVFYNEGFTNKNTRHCVNSLSLQFYPDTGLKEAYFAGGCFWGVEYYLEMKRGVVSAVSGFMGGDIVSPSYKEVVSGKSGHVEVVAVTYDSTVVDYETLARLFFEIHDPTQKDGQGPDIGSQYLSRIFVGNTEERGIIKRLIKELEDKGFSIATEIKDEMPFYPAEAYHQDYYTRKGTVPYCHGYVKRF